MKTIALAVLAVALVGCKTQPTTTLSADDQKWLAAVQQAVKDGDTTLATTSDHRAAILTTWGAQQGYDVSITHSNSVAGYDTKTYYFALTPKGK